MDGFASIHARLQEGELKTKPVTFSGRELSLNVATSAAGMVRVEICDLDGSPIPGFSLDECDLIYGDSIDRRVTWKKNINVESLIGRPVILRFVMREADLYSLIFE